MVSKEKEYHIPQLQGEHLPVAYVNVCTLHNLQRPQGVCGPLVGHWGCCGKQDNEDLCQAEKGTECYYK